MDQGPDWLATPSSWGEGGGGCSTRTFEHVPKAFPFLRAPSCWVICRPLRPLWLLLSSPPGFSSSLLGPVVSFCFSNEHPGLPKPPCPLISLSLPCCRSGPKEISPGRSCSSSPAPGVSRRGEPRAGVTHAGPPPQRQRSSGALSCPAPAPEEVPSGVGCAGSRH